jgi:hypothetical protein
MAETTKLDVGAGALAEYYEWFNGAQHGDVLVYHVGDLAFDRDVLNALTTEQMRDAKALDAVATRIYSDAVEGFLTLIQSRKSPGVFEYRAVRVQTPTEIALQRMAAVDAEAVLA